MYAVYPRTPCTLRPDTRKTRKTGNACLVTIYIDTVFLTRDSLLKKDSPQARALPQFQTRSSLVLPVVVGVEVPAGLANCFTRGPLGIVRGGLGIITRRQPVHVCWMALG